MTSDCIIANTVPANASTAISAFARTGRGLSTALAAGRAAVLAALLAKMRGEGESEGAGDGVAAGLVRAGAGEFTMASQVGSGCFENHPQGSSQGRVNARKSARPAA